MSSATNSESEWGPGQPLNINDLLQRNSELQRELKITKEHESALQTQLAVLINANNASHDTRRAALNLMEDAIAARKSEQEEYAERRRAELAFRESERRYRALFDAMNEGCCIVEEDADSGEVPASFTLVEANSAFEKQVGLSISEHHSLFQRFAEGSPNVIGICREVLQTGQPVKLEQEFVHARVYELSAFRLKHGGRDRVALLLLDITERKRAAEAQLSAAEAQFTAAEAQLVAAEAELVAAETNQRMERLQGELQMAEVQRKAEQDVRITEERFQAFMDQSPAGAFIKDEDGRYVFVNKTLETRFQRPFDQWLGLTDFEIFPAADAGVYRQHELAVLTSNSPGEFNESALQHDGRHHYLSFKFPICDLSGRWFVAGTSIDITKQKQAEETLLANEQRLRALAAELSRVEQQERRRLSSILHEDVQQLLIAMQLRISSIESRLAEPLLKSQTSALMDLLSKTVVTVRTLSRDLVPPTLYQFGLRAGLEWLAGRFATQHGLNVTVSFAEEADTDSQLLRDAIFHITRELLLNVVKHAKTDRASVDLSRSGKSLILVVRDAGVGLQPQQGGRQDSFGLFQIRERLVSMGGSLDLKSAPGMGLEVTVRVPVTEESEL